jgi:hypothetical protein
MQRMRRERKKRQSSLEKKRLMRDTKLFSLTASGNIDTPNYKGVVSFCGRGGGAVLHVQEELPAYQGMDWTVQGVAHSLVVFSNHYGQHLLIF